jgi:hypothetical protein
MNIFASPPADASTPEAFSGSPLPRSAQLAGPSGLLPRQEIRKLVHRHALRAAAFEEAQFQPASLDLRLGSKAFRVRASFLPGRHKTVQQQLEALQPEQISLEGDGAGPRKARRLRGRAAGEPSAPENDRRGGEPEKLDRAARHLHPADRGPERGLRQRRRRL